MSVDCQQDLVQTIEFDNYFKQEKIRLVKIDVEGAEFKVLKGMEKSLSQTTIEYILFEMNDSFLERAKVSRDNIFNLLTKNNYELYHIKYLPLNRYSVEPLKKDKLKFSADNLLAKLVPRVLLVKD